MLGLNHAPIESIQKTVEKQTLARAHAQMVQSRLVPKREWPVAFKCVWLWDWAIDPQVGEVLQWHQSLS